MQSKKKGTLKTSIMEIKGEVEAGHAHAMKTNPAKQALVSLQTPQQQQQHKLVKFNSYLVLKSE